jgi:hypothetical protein
MKYIQSPKEVNDKEKPSSAKPRFFQAKLAVNTPGDAHEQEADAMADKVMRMKDTHGNQDNFFKPNTAIQRKQPAGEEENQHIQKKEDAGGGLDNYAGSLGSSGQPISESSRSFFEPRFGQDFSGVKVHTDANAAKSAQSINALAYTSGNNIVFNSGQYSPESDSGKKLMAHELTHVVQQGGVQKNINKKSDADTVYRKDGWSDAKNKNASAANIDKDGKVSQNTASTVIRIPIEGLKEGNQDSSMTQQVQKLDPVTKLGMTDPVTHKPIMETQKVPTKEEAIGKAIVVLPVALDPTKPVEILLHLHGYNVGYRESGGNVRDIQLDRIEQQIITSGHTQMIGILPQGTTLSKFGAGGFNSDAYINEVLGMVQTGQKWAKTPDIGQVILTAHSGGGNRMEELLPGTKGQLPSKMIELVLFEAINGDGELGAVEKWIGDEVNKDVDYLKTASPADQQSYLAKSKRFRGYYTPGGNYIKRYQALDKFIKNEQYAKVIDNAGLDKAVADEVKDHYQVIVTTAKGVSHNDILGNGDQLQDSFKALPPIPQPAAPVVTPVAPPPTANPVTAPGAVTGTFNTPDSKGLGNTGSSISLVVHIDYLPSHTHLHIFTTAEKGGDYVAGGPMQKIGEPGKGGNYTVILTPVGPGSYITFEARSDTTNINLPNVVGTYTINP